MNTNYEKSCWWQKGGLCYIEPCARNENGRSKKECSGKCIEYWNKREALSTVIPNDKLIIMSEENEKLKNSLIFPCEKTSELFPKGNPCPSCNGIGMEDAEDENGNPVYETKCHVCKGEQYDI